MTNYNFIKAKPYKHQIEILDLSFKHPNLGLFHEMGTGKTFSIINILRYRYQAHKSILNTLIVTPLITLHNWRDEILAYSKIPEKDIVVLDCNGTKRTKRFIDSVKCRLSGDLKYPKIVILNYEALQTRELFDAIKEWGPQVIVADESHRIKNPKARRAKLLIELGDQATYRYALTGTPILNKVTDIYNQYRFLDKGQTFGKNFFVFQSKYMMDKNAGWSSKPGYFPQLEPRPEMFEELQEKMFTIATRVTKEECMDLPPLVKVTRKVTPTPEQLKMYKQMERDLVAYINDSKGQPQAVVAQLALTKALRLQQICSGYVKTEEGDEIDIKDNPKISAVKELLEDIPEKEKIIIWCSFKNNYLQIGKLLEKLKIPHVFITGEQSTKEKMQAMKYFREDKKIRIVVANRKAAGIGVNLVEAGYSIVFSRNFSLEEELQSEARNYRGGSQIHEKITKIDLVMHDSVDELTMLALSGKKNIAELIIDYAKGRI